MGDAPKRIRLCYQSKTADYSPGRGRYVGRVSGGVCWITTPFVPARDGSPGRDFVAVYRWDTRGEFESARIEELPPRPTTTLPGNNASEDYYRDALKRALATVPRFHRRHIDVAPFVHIHEGIEFGLVPRPPEDGVPGWAVTAMPGDYMCFWEPWDGGYDT